MSIINQTQDMATRQIFLGGDFFYTCLALKEANILVHSLMSDQ